MPLVWEVGQCMSPHLYLESQLIRPLTRIETGLGSHPALRSPRQSRPKGIQGGDGERHGARERKTLLTAISMACEDVWREEDLNILIDSLSCIWCGSRACNGGISLCGSIGIRCGSSWCTLFSYECARGSGRSNQIH